MPIRVLASLLTQQRKCTSSMEIYHQILSLGIFHGVFQVIRYPDPRYYFLFALYPFLFHIPHLAFTIYLFPFPIHPLNVISSTSAGTFQVMIPGPSSVFLISHLPLSCHHSPFTFTLFPFCHWIEPYTIHLSHYFSTPTFYYLPLILTLPYLSLIHHSPFTIYLYVVVYIVPILYSMHGPRWCNCTRFAPHHNHPAPNFCVQSGFI